MERAFVLVIAQALDGSLGEPDWLWKRLPHPVVLIGRLIERLDKAWNRTGADQTEGRLWGALTLALVLAVAMFPGVVIEGVADRLPFGDVLIAIVVAVMLAQRSLYDHVSAVAQALETEGLEGGWRAVAMIVGRDPQTLDEAAVSRAAIESTAENLSDGVIAPAFWFLVGGLPGLLAYKALNTADSMIGHRTEKHQHFGWAAARLDDIANWVPARLTALLTVAGAWSLGINMKAAWRSARRDAAKHRSVNAGWPEAAFAGALGLRLAGPRTYDGQIVEDAWMGEGRADANVHDIRRALSLMIRVCCFMAAAAAILALLF